VQPDRATPLPLMAETNLCARYTLVKTHPTHLILDVAQIPPLRVQWMTRYSSGGPSARPLVRHNAFNYSWRQFVGKCSQVGSSAFADANQLVCLSVEQLRIMRQRLCRHAGDAETFNRVVHSLHLADVIEIRSCSRRKTVHLAR
jgi:hypothetical protein